MRTRNTIIFRIATLLLSLVVIFLLAYRFVVVGGRTTKINANDVKGFNSEYYLFIPDSMKR